MERITFNIQGSADEPYTITFARTADSLVALCTCPAGENGQWCKHRLGILRGEADLCSDLAEADVMLVRSWLPGTTLEAAIDEVTASELALAKAQATVKAAKKKLAAAMFGRG